MPEIIGVGESDVDVYLQVDHPPRRGEKVRAREIGKLPGGMTVSYTHLIWDRSGRRRPLFMAGRHLSAGQRDRAVSYTRSADGTVACRRRADSQFGAWDTGDQAD